MKRHKVYLSKSNLATYDDVQRLREELQKYNCEIFEHTGGQYDRRKVVDADYIFFVFPRKSWSQKEQSYVIGKGQFEETTIAHEYSIINFLVDFDNDWFATGVNEPEVKDYNNWQKYGYADFNEEFETLDEIISLCGFDRDFTTERPLTDDEVFKENVSLGTIKHFKDKAK